MLTLDATLQTRQDSNVREPLIELSSNQLVNDIPFQGAYFNASATAEHRAEALVLSTGGIFSLFLYEGADGSPSKMYLRYTDSEQQQWTTVPIIETAIVQMMDCVEMPDGNIGVILLYGGSAPYTLRSMILTPTGTIVTGPTTIYTFSSGAEIAAGMTVELQSNGVYRMVYSDWMIAYSPDRYYLYTRTSADFLTWSGATQITVSGLNYEGPLRGVDLKQTTADGLMLAFDYSALTADLDGGELSNIYYMLSNDNGATWGTPVKVTSYTQLGIDGKHPSIAERENGQIELVYYEEDTVIRVNRDTDGYDDCHPEAYTKKMYAGRLHYDAASGLLFVVSGTNGSDGTVCSVTVIDTSDFSIEKIYTTETIPAFNDYFKDTSSGSMGLNANCSGSGQRVVLFNHLQVAVINHATQEITHYALESNAPYFITQNVAYDKGGWIVWSYLDESNNRLYLCFLGTVYRTDGVLIGYLDLSEVIAGEQQYSFTTVVDDHTGWNLNVSPKEFAFSVEEGYIVACNPGPIHDWNGQMIIYTFTGNTVANYSYPTTPSFPIHGTFAPCIYNGHVYAAFEYENLYDQDGRRGLMDLDIASGGFFYHRPTYITRDDYYLRDIRVGATNQLVIATLYDGAVIFDIGTQQWTQYSNATITGFTTDSPDQTGIEAVAYMSDKDMLAIGRSEYYNPGEVIFVLISGSFKQSQYMTGTFGTDWSFASALPLTVGYSDYEMSAVIDQNNKLWGLWTKKDGTELSLLWANETGTTDLTDLIVAGSSVSLSWSVDSPAKLSFSLTHGHLFDPNNLMSTWNGILAKGRRILVRIGELIDEVEYWHNQGTFIVTDLRLSYQRGQYPTVDVSCEDRGVFWQNAKITGSKPYSDVTGASLLDDLLKTYAYLIASDFSIPAFDTDHEFYCQFIDEDLEGAVREILDHLQYFGRWDVDGVWNPRKIDVSGDVTHTYAEAHLIQFTPDDSLSDFTNRVTVVGETHEMLEIIHPEEIVGSLSGTMGWWGGTEEIEVWYSEDHKRICRSPRLEILTSLADHKMFVFKGGGTESLTYEDPEGKYCIVTLEGPNYQWIIFTEGILVVATGLAAVPCGWGDPCGPYIYALSLSIQLLSYSLATVAAYSYKVHARPLGHQRQTVQATANDTDLQQSLNGVVIESRIEDPYCYSVQECQRVADYELSIIQAQRRRLSFSKIAHLQDEVGDVLQVKHPYTNEALSVVVTDLQRRYTKPERSSVGGGVIDAVTGWRQVTG